MFIAKEEHDRHRVVQLVHAVELGHLVDVAQVHDREVLDLLRDLRQHVVLAQAVRVRDVAEADHHEPVRFAEDGLVDVPC